MTDLIYEPRGRAREYAALACNIYNGCDHGAIELLEKLGYRNDLGAK